MVVNPDQLDGRQTFPARELTEKERVCADFAMRILDELDTKSLENDGKPTITDRSDWALAVVETSLDYGLNVAQAKKILEYMEELDALSKQESAEE